MEKYWQLFRVSLRHRNVFLFDVVASLFSYAVRVLLIMSLFRYLHASAPHLFWSVSLLELGWALIFAQIAAVGSPNLAMKVSEDVKTGKVAIYLLNPVSYPFFKTFEVLSWSLANLAVMSGIAFIIGAVFVGLPDLTLGGMFGGLFLLVWAFVIFALLNLNVWLLAFVMEDISPANWIMRRFVMFFWGNILPIPFFPSWLQAFAYASPFAFTGYVAGLVFANFNPGKFLVYASTMAFWIFALSGLAAFSYSRFSRRLVANGG